MISSRNVLPPSPSGANQRPDPGGAGAIWRLVRISLTRPSEKRRTRRDTVEHPFGTTKSWMRATRFHMRTLKKVGNQMALLVLAYNLRRVTNILAIDPLIAAMKAA
jgi:IS5 family transposase